MPQPVGDRYEVFLSQFTAHEASLRAYVRRLVPTRHDTADIMQGIALVLWKKFAELDSADNFRRWAFGVARYESLAWLRDRARDRHVLGEELLGKIAHESAQLDDRLEAQREALEHCLKKMPAQHRSLVLRAYMPGERVRDIAQESGRSVGGFYQWLHRMRLQLLACVQRSFSSERPA